MSLIISFPALKIFLVTFSDVLKGIKSLLNNLKTLIQEGKAFNKTTNVGGKQIRYTKYKLPCSLYGCFTLICPLKALVYHAIASASL